MVETWGRDQKRQDLNLDQGTYCDSYHLVIYHSHGNSPFLIGKPSINGPFSMAMLNNQMVSIQLCQSFRFEN